jgi:hypothetical protein
VSAPVAPTAINRSAASAIVAAVRVRFIESPSRRFSLS